ncbi:MAG: hypothetical protein U0802_13015 [Candidatus Binatia bacterium]
MQPAARDLMLDLLATLQSGSAMPVGALVEAGALFGISENNVRVTMARLLADGRVARDERGRYASVTRRARSANGCAAGAGAIVRRAGEAGDWLAIHAGAARRPAQRGRARALRLLGFAALRPGLWIRPDNPRPAARRGTRRAGPQPACRRGVVCTLGALDPASEGARPPPVGRRRAAPRLPRPRRPAGVQRERLAPRPARRDGGIVPARWARPARCCSTRCCRTPCVRRWSATRCASACGATIA